MAPSKKLEKRAPSKKIFLGEDVRVPSAREKLIESTMGKNQLLNFAVDETLEVYVKCAPEWLRNTFWICATRQFTIALDQVTNIL